MADIIKEFKFDLQIRKYSERTIKTAVNSTKAFSSYINREFNVEELEEITHIHIKQYVYYLQKQGRVEVYINSILKYLRMFYRYCTQEEYVLERTNPCLKVKWTREPKSIINTFKDDEVIRMLKQWDYKSYYNARNKAILATFFETGIRNLELCRLNMTDVRETVILVHGKGNKERYVPISPALKKIFIKYERIRTEYIKNKLIEEDCYFYSYRGKRITVESIERVVKQTGKLVKIRKEIRCSPHTIRHYYAQFMLR